MAMITFTDEKEPVGSQTLDSPEPFLRTAGPDFSFLTSYLKGSSIEEIAAANYKTRAKIFSEIEQQLYMLRTKLYHQIPEKAIANPKLYSEFWLCVIEDYRIYSFTEDPANIEMVYYNQFLTRAKVEQMAIVDELRQYLEGESFSRMGTVDSKQFLDIKLLEDFFKANSRNNYKTSNGFIFTDMRIKSYLRALVGDLREVVRNEFLEYPLRYSDFWLPLLERYKLREKMKDPFTIDSDFVDYFKSLPKKNRQKLFSTMEENIKYN